MTPSMEMLRLALGKVDRAHARASMLAAHSEDAHGEESPEARSAAAIREELSEALRMADRAGVQPEATGKERAAGFDLHGLAELDAGKPEALELIDALRALLPLALDLDTRRGRVVSEKVPLQPGETPSTDVAELLSDLVYRLEQEAGVGVGKGRE